MKHPSLYDRVASLGSKLYAGVDNFLNSFAGKDYGFNRPGRFAKTRGEARLSRLAGPYNSARYGSRTWDKFQQIRQYKSWVYRCVEFISQGIRVPPDIATVVPEGERMRYNRELQKWRTKGYQGDGPVRRKFLSDVRRKTAVGPIKPHEDYEFLENDHPAVRLVNDPNEFMTGVRFWQLCGTFEELTGESFTWMVEDGAGRVVELWQIPSQWVTPRNDGQSGKMVDYYEVRSQNGPVEQFDPEEIIWCKNDNPWHPLYVTSRVQTAGTTIDAYEMTEFARYAAMENGVGSSGVITMPPDLNPPQDLVDRLEARFLAKNAGPANAGRPLILNSGLEWTPPAAAMELAFLQSEEQLRRHIMAHWGLDEAMMGFANEATYAGAVVTKRSLFERVYSPRLEDRAATLTERLLPRFGVNLRALYMPSPSSEDPDAKRQDWDIAVNAGAVTKNEIRTELLGLEPHDDPSADELPQDPMEALGGDMTGWDAEGDKTPRPGFQKDEKSLTNRITDHGELLNGDATGYLMRLAEELE